MCKYNVNYSSDLQQYGINILSIDVTTANQFRGFLDILPQINSQSLIVTAITAEKEHK